MTCYFTTTECIQILNKRYARKQDQYIVFTEIIMDTFSQPQATLFARLRRLDETIYSPEYNHKKIKTSHIRLEFLSASQVYQNTSAQM